MNFKANKISKGKRINKSWQRFGHKTIHEMSSYNVLRRVGSYFCVNGHFPGTLVNFRFKIFIPERISTHVDLCL